MGPVSAAAPSKTLKQRPLIKQTTPCRWAENDGNTMTQHLISRARAYADRLRERNKLAAAIKAMREEPTFWTDNDEVFEELIKTLSALAAQTQTKGV